MSDGKELVALEDMFVGNCNVLFMINKETKMLRPVTVVTTISPQDSVKMLHWAIDFLRHQMESSAGSIIGAKNIPKGAEKFLKINQKVKDGTLGRKI